MDLSNERVEYDGCGEAKVKRARCRSAAAYRNAHPHAVSMQ
ncbi:MULTISPECIES: hypothetical protein [unclassified Lysobacter]|nr:hypothetical protein [Lysobacter sp. MMG2]